MADTSEAGFIINASAVAAVSDSYATAKRVRLFGVDHDDESTTIVDDYARSLPPSALWQNLEIQLSAIAGGAATLTFFLAWDEDGDYRATREVAVTIETGVTTATQGTVVSAIDGFFKQPKTGGIQTTSGELYLFAKTDAGTVTIDIAKMYWRRGLVRA